MSLFRYPQNDLDNNELLLNLLGTFWATTYQGNSLLQDLTTAKGQLMQQTYFRLLELVASVSRKDIPLYSEQDWSILVIRESDLNTNDVLLHKYVTNNTVTYSSQNTTAYYGQRSTTQDFVVDTPAGLTNCYTICNRLIMPTVSLIQGIDYVIDEAVIRFKANPFLDTRIAKKDLLDNQGNIVDREITLWLYGGMYDLDWLYEQFGYALRLKLKTSKEYKQFINAIFDAFTEGTSIRTQQLALAAVFGVPLVIEAEETVENIVYGNELIIVTDKNVYMYPSGALATVSVGDRVIAGDTLTDMFQIFELNTAPVLTVDQLKGLVLEAGLLGYGFFGGLVFENKEVPIQVETVDGYTKISWELGGFSFDASKFWEDTHAAGIAKDQTLAMLLDLRDNPTTQPTAASLPTTINPLQFLISNFLRNNATILKLKSGFKVSNKLAFIPVEQLRKIQPPHTILIVVTDLQYQEDAVSTTNFTETVSTFDANSSTETLSPTSLTETLRATKLGGRCV